MIEFAAQAAIAPGCFQSLRQDTTGHIFAEGIFNRYSMVEEYRKWKNAECEN
jgi:hypothetical protein